MNNHWVCKICKKPLSSRSIGRTDRKVSGLCHSCYLTGQNNHAWKGGRPKCLDCGKELLSGYGRKRCKECFHKFYQGNKAYQWKGGKPKCQKCGKQLSTYKSTHCLRHRSSGKTRLPDKKCLDCGTKLSRDALWRGSKYCKVHIFSGSRSPHWQGGITPLNFKLRNSARYKKWRDKCFKRDNWTCQNCSYRGKGLQVDHIKAFSLFPKLRFVIKNGRTLCKDCHQLLGWRNRKVRL